MPKIPRDLSGIELCKILAKFGYEITRQSGSHIRLTTTQKSIHNITIPAHNPLKIGTFNAILQEVANHFGMTKKELVEKLF